MPLHPVYLLPFLVFAAGAVRAEAAALLEVDVEPASAVVKPLPPGRKLVRLPELEYRINIRARCADDDTVESLSIGIADTRRTLGSDELAEPDTIVVEFTVPARQVAPLPVNRFCLAEGEGDQEVLVDDAVTAHLSLRCANDTGTAITYASRPLAVALSCDAGNQPESDSPTLR